MEYIVYVKTNVNGYITAVNSSAFLDDATGWVEIDQGRGDKYHHAQGNYFPEPVTTDGGAYRYKLVDGVAIACTDDEIAQQEKEMAEQDKSAEDPTQSLEERVSTIEADVASLTAAVEKGLAL